MSLKHLLKTLSIVVIITQLWSLIVSTKAENEEYRYFVVTAYYSPLPDQNYYLTWDYQREKRLNGQGIAWASGKPVFSGMLAAPANYRFWTKIELDGIWVWVVEDRWGAIVPAWNRGYQHDRIDIWVWYGDEGLRRALYWGKRTIRGRVVSNTRETSINIENLSAPEWVTANIPAQRNVPGVMFYSGNTKQNSQSESQWVNETKSTTITEQIPHLFLTSMGRDASWERVEELQNILITLWYLGEEAKSWIYDRDTITAIFELQKEHEICHDLIYYSSGLILPDKHVGQLLHLHLKLWISKMENYDLPLVLMYIKSREQAR